MDERNADILGNDDLELSAEDAENVAGGRELTKRSNLSTKSMKDYPTCPEGSVDDPLCGPLAEDARYISILGHGFKDPSSTP